MPLRVHMDKCQKTIDDVSLILAFYCFHVSNQTGLTTQDHFTFKPDNRPQRYTCLEVHTVNIDKLSERGVVFTDAHTSSAVCTPTRYGILTGRYNWRSTLKQGVLSGFSKALIEPGRLTVASFLKDKGYSTGFVGKWHLGWDWAVRDEVDLDKLDLHPTVDYSKPIENGPQSLGFTYSYGFSGSYKGDSEIGRPSMHSKSSTNSL